MIAEIRPSPIKKHHSGHSWTISPAMEFQIGPKASIDFMLHPEVGTP
jgi:hypothetical protein